MSAGSAASKLGETDYFAMLRSFLRAAYPSAKMKFVNGAVAATTSAYMAICLDNHIPLDADLTVVEYATNVSSQIEACSFRPDPKQSELCSVYHSIYLSFPSPFPGRVSRNWGLGKPSPAFGETSFAQFALSVKASFINPVVHL